MSIKCTAPAMKFTYCCVLVAKLLHFNILNNCFSQLNTTVCVRFEAQTETMIKCAKPICAFNFTLCYRLLKLKHGHRRKINSST